MKSEPIQGKQALEEFTRTMKALFRVPKSVVQKDTQKSPKSKKPKPH